MPNILITGIRGFIGSNLADYLSQNPENNIYGLCRSIKNESPFNALKLQNKKNINLLIGDINDYSKVEEILVQYNIDEIYHLAAKVIVQDAAKFPIATCKINIFGTLNVLEALRLISLQRNKQIPTFIMSTDKSYGISDELPYNELLPLNGLDIYSASKACEDILARSYSYNYDLPIVIARPSNTYGVDFNWSRLVPSVIKSCLLGEPLILNKGSYNYIREYIYVEDLVKAIHLLVKNIDKTKGEAYNISSNFKYTTEQAVNKILKLTNNKNKQIQFKEKESIFKEIPEQYLNTEKIKKATNWKPEYDLQTGLKLTINKYKEWFESHNNLATNSADEEMCRQKYC